MIFSKFNFFESPSISIQLSEALWQTSPCHDLEAIEKPLSHAHEYFHLFKKLHFLIQPINYVSTGLFAKPLYYTEKHFNTKHGA